MPLIRNLHKLLLSNHSDCNHGIWRNLSTSERKKFEGSCQKLSIETSMYPVNPLSFSFNYFVHTSCKEWSWGVGRGVLYLLGVKKSGPRPTAGAYTIPFKVLSPKIWQEIYNCYLLGVKKPHPQNRTLVPLSTPILPPSWGMVWCKKGGIW